MLPKDVEITTNEYLLSKIIEDIEEGYIFIDSDEVINIKKGSEIIASLLLRIPLPKIYLSELDINSRIIVGKKLLEILYSFFHDEYIYIDTGFFPELNGMLFSEFPLRYRRRLKEILVTCIKIRCIVPDDVREDVERRIKNFLVEV